MTTTTKAPTDLMLRILSILLWTAVFLLIVLAVDQLLLRVPATLPAHAAVATFYRELRSRVLELAEQQPRAPAPAPAAAAPKKPAAAGKTREAPARPPASVEKVIEQRQARKATPPPAKKPGEVAAPPPTSVEAIIEQQATGTAPPPAAARPPANRPATREPTMRYLFADEQGNLHFAGTLAEVPEQYRDKARLVRE